MSRLAARAPQAGQATTEFVVLALVLAPMFLLIPLVGQTIDLAQVAEAASRYAAFEAVVGHSGSAWTPDDTLAADVRRRFFSHPEAPVKTGDVAADIAAHRNPLWSDFTGRPLLPRFADDVSVTRHIDRPDAIPAAAFAGDIALSSDNLAAAQVTVTPAPVAELPPFDTLRLRIARRTVLLADAWTAADPASVREHIEASSRLRPLEPVERLIDLAGRLPTLVLDPSFHVGEFDWDIVPCDRLVGGC